MLRCITLAGLLVLLSIASACAPVPVPSDTAKAAAQINAGALRFADVNSNGVAVNLVALRGEPAGAIDPPLRLVIDSLPLRREANIIVAAPTRYIWQPSGSIAGRPAAADIFLVRVLTGASFARGYDADFLYGNTLSAIAAASGGNPDAFFARLGPQLTDCVLGSLRASWPIVVSGSEDPLLASSIQRRLLVPPPYRGQTTASQPSLDFRMPVANGQPCSQAPLWSAYGGLAAYLADGTAIKFANPSTLKRYQPEDDPDQVPAQLRIEVPVRRAWDWRDDYVAFGTSVADLERRARRKVTAIDRIDVWFPTTTLGEAQRRRAVREGRFKIAFVAPGERGGFLPTVDLPDAAKHELLLLPGDLLVFGGGDVGLSPYDLTP